MRGKSVVYPAEFYHTGNAAVGYRVCHKHGCTIRAGLQLTTAVQLTEALNRTMFDVLTPCDAPVVVGNRCTICGQEGGHGDEHAAAVLAAGMATVYVPDYPEGGE